jgi:chromosomal replication initiation ATPase DnaA
MTMSSNHQANVVLANADTFIPTVTINLFDYNVLVDKAKHYDKIVEYNELKTNVCKNMLLNAALEVSSRHFNIPVDDIIDSKKRKKIHVSARDAVLYCLLSTSYTQVEIAKVLNKNDHTVISFHIRKINGYIDVDENYRTTMNYILQTFKLKVRALQKHL